MITEYFDLLKDRETFERVAFAISKTNGKAFLLVHPFFRDVFKEDNEAMHEYPDKYEKAVRKIVKQDEVPVFILEYVLKKERTRARLLKGVSAKDNEIVMIPTYTGDITPDKKALELIDSSEREMLFKTTKVPRVHRSANGPEREAVRGGEVSKRLFVETLTHLGVEEILLGGEGGKLWTDLSEKKFKMWMKRTWGSYIDLRDGSAPGGCVYHTEKYIRKYSNIRIKTLKDTLHT